MADGFTMKTPVARAILAQLFAFSCVLLAANAPSHANDDAAHALADRFSAEKEASTAKKTPEPVQSKPKKSKSPQYNSQALVEKIEEAERRVEEARQKEEAARKRAEQARRQAYEKEMLARARAEAAARAEAERKQAQTRSQESLSNSSNAASKTATDTVENTKVTASQEQPEEAKQPAVKQVNVKESAVTGERIKVLPPDVIETQTPSEDLAKKRDEEADALEEKLRRAREVHQAIKNKDKPSLDAGPDNGKTRTSISAYPDVRAPTAELTPSNQSPPRTVDKQDTKNKQEIRRVTVLLKMKPGKRGIRRWKKTADPMLCFKKHCYISRGGNVSAQRISRKRGFGPGIALGKRAGACRNSLICVFRDVRLVEDGPRMQPIDLRVVRHDRRSPRDVAVDRSCHVKADKLNCGKKYEAKDWQAWIVPENVANHAGPDLLEAALESGLTSTTTSAAR